MNLFSRLGVSAETPFSPPPPSFGANEHQEVGTRLGYWIARPLPCTSRGDGGLMVQSMWLARAAGDAALEIATYWRRALFTFLAGFVVLLALHDPVVEQSVVGQLDRDMTTTAFNLRADVFVGEGDPVLLMDIDNATIATYQAEALMPGREPSASASRGLIADLLRYILASPPGRGPKAVILDVDLAAPTAAEPQGIRRLHEALAAWAADRNAPTLIISRESFTSDLLGGGGTSARSTHVRIR